MEVKTMLPESFENEEKDEKEWEAFIAPMKTILKILQITKGIVLVLGILLCILFAIISDATTSTIVSAVITLAFDFWRNCFALLHWGAPLQCADQSSCS